MVQIHIVRDVETKGCDYLAWGLDPEQAGFTFDDMRAKGFKVEQVAMDSDHMDPHTKSLICGPVSEWDLDAAAALPDVNEAALWLQIVCEITDGGMAAYCLDQLQWGVADRTERRAMLRHWLSAEQK